MKKYIKYKNWLDGEITTKRMVNQPEIVDYIKRNPYSCERDIMYYIYGFLRGGNDSNKKYAECLRRALRSGKISRVRMIRKNDQSRIFYYILDPKHTFTEWLSKG